MDNSDEFADKKLQGFGNDEARKNNDNPLKRPEKDRYYLNIAKEIASRARCFRSHHGVIIVKDDQIIATGYNGAPRKTKDCIERGYCIRDLMNIPSGQRYEICRTVHGEANCLINAARSGTSVINGDIYMASFKVSSGKKEPIDSMPCFICKKMIINAGINRLIAAMADGSYKTFHTEDWIKEWQIKDMIDDKEVYNANHKSILNEQEKNKIIDEIKK